MQNQKNVSYIGHVERRSRIFQENFRENFFNVPRFRVKNGKNRIWRHTNKRTVPPWPIYG
jgi:hypothetical protein